MRSAHVRLLILTCILWLALTPASAQQVIVVGGIDEARDWLKGEQWWGELTRDEPMIVPRVLATGINPGWRETAQQLSVADKKQIFYRLMLPLVVHANDMVRDRRARLEALRAEVIANRSLTTENVAALRSALPLLRIRSAEQADQIGAEDSEELLAVIDEALYKLDVIPSGLVLGQAAYESGYGTSRFAVEGNALFGQWTYGGKGLVPEQQRKQLGDHRIAAYDWPFDSVRGYFLNLSSHPAYEDFRRLRAELRASGRPMTSLALADGLIRYSERGQEYVDTLKSMIRVNHLDVADDATFRDESLRFLVAADDPAGAEAIRTRVAEMRQNGELDAIVARMRLE